MAKDTDNNRVLAISRYGIEYSIFDDDSSVWKDSEICSLLNDNFYNTAFTDAEKGFINSTKLSDVDDSGSTYNVFLLSRDEAVRYFINDDERRCIPTYYTVKKGARVSGGYVSCWLRTPYTGLVCIIDHDGSLGSSGFLSIICYAYKVVRPALWINL